nr:hypothetical protein [Massilia sp. 9096]
MVRKLGTPGQAEFATGAVGSGGVRVLQPGVPGLMGVTARDVDAVAARELAELARREQAYRGVRAPLAIPVTPPEAVRAGGARWSACWRRRACARSANGTTASTRPTTRRYSTFWPMPGAAGRP